MYLAATSASKISYSALDLKLLHNRPVQTRFCFWRLRLTCRPCANRGHSIAGVRGRRGAVLDLCGRKMRSNNDGGKARRRRPL